MLVWRCRNHAERLRLLDMSVRLRPATRWSALAMAIVAAIALPAYGWAMELPLALAAMALAVSQPLLDHVRRPEDVLAGVWLFALLAIVAAIGLAGGPRIYTLSILLLPTLLAAPVFPGRVVAFGAAATVAAMAGAAFMFMPAAVASLPPVLIIPAAITAVIAMLAVRTLEAELASREAAVIDPLTGLLNRSALQSRVAELPRPGPARPALAVIVAEVDHFKAIDHAHGHATGDAVLVEVARRLQRVVATNGALHRFGGEAFVVLLEGSGAAAAPALAERMRSAIVSDPLAGRVVTMSLGVSCLAEEVAGYPSLFAAADRALYRAKAAGRDCVRTLRPGDAVAGRGMDATPLDRRSRAIDPARANGRVSDAPADGGDATHVVATPRRDRGSLILPTVADRRHMLEIVARTRETGKLANPILVLALLAGVPWLGWRLLIPIVLSAGTLQLILSRAVPRVERPEYPLVAGLVLVVLATGAAFLVADRTPLFALPLFTILMFSSAAGLPARSAAVLGVFTGAVMCIVAVLLDASAVAQTPSILAFPLALLASMAIYGHAIVRTTFDRRELSTSDHLTGALTRAALYEHLDELARREGRRREPISLLVADLDQFKAINDERGHARGDVVLAAAVERIRSSLRPLDPVYRVGGEEFLVMLEGADLAGATSAAERVRATVGRHRLSGVAVTVSVGVATVGADEAFDYDRVFARAATALLAAKAAGRDRVVADATVAMPEPVAA